MLGRSAFIDEFKSKRNYYFLARMFRFPGLYGESCGQCAAAPGGDPTVTDKTLGDRVRRYASIQRSRRSSADAEVKAYFGYN